MNGGRGAGRGPAFAKPKEKTSVVLLKLWRYLEKYRWIIVLAAILSFLGNALGLVSPRLSGAAINAIESETGVQFPVVYKYVLLMILPVCACLTLGDLSQLKMQTVNSRNIIFLFQHRSDGGFR